MARGDQLARQWKIIQMLISSRRGKSGPDLAEELGCHSRTIYRDLEALQVAGFPVYRERIEGKNLTSPEIHLSSDYCPAVPIKTDERWYR